jgi:hypothetical protein
MPDRIAADAVLIVHFAFIVFVVFGGALLLLWPRIAWLHVPAVFWATVVELTGWICPLTPLENTLQRSSGGPAYAGDFVGHYLVALIYPEGLTRGTQMLLAVAVIVVNALFYGVLLFRMRERAAPPSS